MNGSVTSRLEVLATRFGQQPVASIPQASGNWVNSKAAYRFCANEKVAFGTILVARAARTLEWLAPDTAVVLCSQDTTTLDYITNPATQGLGHATLGVSPQGDFFGLLHAHCWARPPRRRRTAPGQKNQ